MRPSATEILTNPHPKGHIVYPYSNEDQVAEAICLFASAGLRKGEAVLLVMTEAHRQAVTKLLEEEKLDPRQLELNGQLVCGDAQDLLESFMSNGVVDEDRFRGAIGKLIADAKAANVNRAVRVFGEMVDLIWTSNPQGTQRIEELWNEVIETHSVPLLCAYALSGTRPTLTPELVACHSHAIA